MSRQVHEEIIRLFEADPVGWHFDRYQAYYNYPLDSFEKNPLPLHPSIRVWLFPDDHKTFVCITRPMENHESILSRDERTARFDLCDEAAKAIHRVMNPAFRAAQADVVERERQREQEHQDKINATRDDNLGLLKTLVRRVEAGLVE